MRTRHPFYSLLRGIAVEDVWHDNTECPIGRSIQPGERIHGTGFLTKHCPYCQVLNVPSLGEAKRAGRR